MHFNVKNRRTQSTFQVKPEQSVLSAAIEAGLALPHSCRAGNCGSCKARLVRGEIVGDDFDDALSQREREQGFILLCCAMPKSDLEIDIDEFTEGMAPARFWPARIRSLKLLCHDVMQINLALPPGKQFDYLPGQYVDIVLAGNRRRSFSIANAPSSGELELHIRRVEGGELSRLVFEEYKTGDVVRLYGPLGTFVLRASRRPVLMMAGGTGLAPLKALLEQISLLDDPVPVRLYWGVRTLDDVYLKLWLEMFAQTHPWFSAAVVLSEPGMDWGGRKGLVHLALLDDHADLDNYDIYASGPPPMITAAQTEFAGHGFDPQRFFFDSFDYSADTLAVIRGKKNRTV